MDKPVLIIMAAGMGSRYGGVKQMDAMDEDGHWIMDYSVFDAVRAGFERVIFVIKDEMKDSFEATVGKRLSPHIQVNYAFQRLENLPEGFSVPEGRVKPWGTAHAVLSAKALVNGPFAVINADDFYGPQAFQIIYDFLSGEHTENEHAMIGFKLENTLTEHGYVSRGVCRLDENDCMSGITERVHIEAAEGGAIFTEGEQSEFLPNGTIVSMNFWGFQSSMMDAIEQNFSAYLNENLSQNPLKCEYFLPLIPNKLIHEGKASVKVLTTNDRWYGVTYKEDKDRVVSALQTMRESGKYPRHLWE